MQENSDKIQLKWHHPTELLKLQKLKTKKRALQARFSKTVLTKTVESPSNETNNFENVLLSKKRKNPFVVNTEGNKRNKKDIPVPVFEESSDQTLFKLLNQSASANIASTTTSFTSFNNILNKVQQQEEEIVEVVKGEGEKWFPIDWSLKTKIRLWSKTPFPWNNKLKISEEASGITSFTRCLDTTSDTASNARFHQCSLYWQHPTLPWMTLFPRTIKKTTSSDPTTPSFVTSSTIRSSLYSAWTDSFRSLFQLIRTKQCPFFYLCTHNFTSLFRAAGISGFDDVHVLITPSTRGFRNLLKQEEIEFTMPLKKKRNSDQGCETLDSIGDQTVDVFEGDEEAEEDEEPNEEWLKEMGINADDIKKINYSQAKINHKMECEVDNSEQSLVLIEGVEVNCFYNFLLNCKTITPTTGTLAGIPPTLLAPVAFHGATLNSLKVRESKVHMDNCDFYSMEISGPILPSTVHNLFSINPHDHSMSATFTSLQSTNTFSKIKKLNAGKNSLIFDKENLSECGLNNDVLKQFCMSDPKFVTNIECLKYNSDNKTFNWT